MFGSMISDADLLEVDHRGLHPLVVDEGTVAVLGQVALRLGQAGAEPLLQPVPEELLRQPDGRPRVVDDLHCLDPGELVEEPAAARVHELRVALELHELRAPAPRSAGVELAGALALQEAGPALDPAVEEDVDVGVPCRPRVLEERRRPPPRTAGPARPAASRGRRAAGRARPGSSPDGPRCCSRSRSTSARPRGRSSTRCASQDLHLLGGRVPLQVLAVVGEPRQALLLDVSKRVGQRHLAVAVVVAVGLAVGRDVDELGPVAGCRRRPRPRRSARYSPSSQEPLEGHRPGDRAVVEEECDAAGPTAA